MKCLIISILIAAVFLSGCSSTANNTANADPFGHIYRVTETLISEDASANLDKSILINLSAFHNLSIMEDTTTYDFAMVGELKETELVKGDTRKGLWTLVRDDTPVRYEVSVEDDDSVVLTHRIANQIQWSYRLARVDMVSVSVSTFGTREHLEIDWYFAGTFPGNLLQLSSGSINGKGKIGFSVEDESIDKITVIEEYYTDGNVEYAEYQLTREEGFSIAVRTKYDTGDQYAVYRIPNENGEYVFYVKYK